MTEFRGKKLIFFKIGNIPFGIQHADCRVSRLMSINLKKIKHAMVKSLMVLLTKLK